MKPTFISIAAFCLVVLGVQAATFTPTTTSDFPVSGAGISVNTTTGVISGGAGNGTITVRSAVIAANAHSGSTISIPAGTYTLSIVGDDGNGDPDPTIGDLDVLASITITGAGPGSTIIQAGTSLNHGIDQILTLNSYYTSRGQSAVINGFASTVTGITFRYGTCLNSNTQSGSYAGGAISFDAGYNNGGPITSPGSMLISNCVFDSCTAHYGGGAVVTFDGGAVTIDSCVFTNNQGTPFPGAGASGGAIVFGSTPNSGTVIVKNTTFINNVAGNGAGGAILFFGGAADPGFIHNCLFTGNAADGEAGALLISGPLTVDQGTIFSNNISRGAGNQDAQGGGLEIQAGPTVISNCIIVSNIASLTSADQRGGGGIAVSGASPIIVDCRIYGNVASTGTGLHKDLNTGAVTAINNWWGNNGGPGVGGADTAVVGGGGVGGGSITSSPFLVMNLSASPTSDLVGGNSTVTASITKNSSSTSGFTVPNGTPISFGSTLGTMSPSITTLNSSTASSTYTPTTTGTGSASATVDAQTLTMSITNNQIPIITSATNATFTVGTSGSFTMTATGFPAPKFGQSGTLPSVVSFTAATGVLAGTPAAGTGGAYSITLTASNSVGTNTQNFTLIVNQPALITSATNATFVVGSNGTFTVTATGFPVPTVTENGALPGGVSFNTNTHVLSGTPAAATGGSYPISFKATNAAGTNTQNFTLTVNQTPAVTCPANIVTNAAGGVCQLPTIPFAATATGNPAPVLSYKIGSTPITSPFTFLIGTSTVTSIATNSGGTNSCTFTVTVNPGPAPELSIVPNGKNKVVVSWSNAYPCYTLQTAPLLASNNWTTFVGTLMTNGSVIFTTNTVSSSNAYYRLIH